MYVYYIRWTLFDGEYAGSGGDCEYKTDAPISTIEEIDEISELILESLKEDYYVELLEDAKVLIDFYSLLRKEE